MDRRPRTGNRSLNDHRDPLPTRVDETPDLPPAFSNALDAAFEALLAAGIPTGQSARDAITAQVRLLLAWNQSINLTAIVDPVSVARRHVADSLAGLPIVAEGRHERLLDVGSGAGFPGFPLAAASPVMRATLLDSVGKKAAFLRAVAEATGLGDRIEVRGERAEAQARGRWDVVTARAVGSLADLIEVGLPLLVPGGRLIAWKRGGLESELIGARRAAAAIGGSEPAWRPHPDSLTAAADLPGHGVVVVTKTSASPADYPRDPALRKRRPW